MILYILFGILSIPIIILSRRTLFSIGSHGFFRFLSWECILWLAVNNYQYWFMDSFSLRQIFSWIFLIISGYLVIAGVLRMKKQGKAGNERKDESLYKFEKTTMLVDTGIFRYIRHPLYASLLFLTWGIYMKNVEGELLLISLLSTLFLVLTALFDEAECLESFGEPYRAYMKKTKRFIPFLV